MAINYVLLTALISVLIITFYQDIKRRSIHILLPVALFSISLVLNYRSDILTYEDTLKNLGFLVINLVGLFTYLTIKSRRFVNPINQSIGLGDIVFFVALTPAMELHAYMVVFISGLLFSLVFHQIVLLFRKVKTIPLAGYMSLFIIGILMIAGIKIMG